VPVLSQSVLLRGVNDRIEVLVDLCERLADLRVVPYYLHQLDRVAGAAHFEVRKRPARGSPGNCGASARVCRAALRA